MIDVDFYFTQLARKRKWSVSEELPSQHIDQQVASLVERALTMRHLELQVQEWIEEEAKKLGDDLSMIMMENAKDEDKHDKALNAIANVCYPNPNRYATTIYDIRHQFNCIAEKDGPVTVAGVVESSVFFVVLPILRFFGSPAMRTAATDISSDESVHVSCNVQLTQDLGYTRSNVLNRLRKETVRWIVQDLPFYNHNDPKRSQDFWLKASDNLYCQGKTEVLGDTRAPIMNALFEQDNRHITTYG